MSTTGPLISREDFTEAFARTKYRGPDDTKIISAGPGLMGFHRLSIMGLTPEGMQPFELSGCTVICNGEHIRSDLDLTVSCCCRCGWNTERKCSGCWMLNSYA